MNDVKELLDLAALPVGDGHVDPAGDLVRGRRLLQRRRRWYGGAGVAAMVAVTGVAAFTAQGAAKPLPTEPPSGTHLAVRLVKWEGLTPPGYRVAWMPSGWVIQGGNQFSLTIAPSGDRDKDSDSFNGKLVVMLQSADAHGTPPGAAQQVSGRPGYLESASEAGGDTEILTFQTADRQWVQVQAPMSLGWDGTELATFAAGVQVLGNAQPGHG